MYKCLNTYEYTFPSNKAWQVCVHRVVMPQCFAHNLKTFASVDMHESVFCMYMYAYVVLCVANVSCIFECQVFSESQLRYTLLQGFSMFKHFVMYINVKCDYMYVCMYVLSEFMQV